MQCCSLVHKSSQKKSRTSRDALPADPFGKPGFETLEILRDIVAFARQAADRREKTVIELPVDQRIHHLAAFPPLDPTDVKNVSTEGPTVRRFAWNFGCESDLSCYRVEYGPAPSLLDQVAVTPVNSIVFPGFPSHEIFFRVQAVDNQGYRSGFTRVHTTADKPRTKRGRHVGEIGRVASLGAPTASGESGTKPGGRE